jgi:hypothetical protein
MAAAVAATNAVRHRVFARRTLGHICRNTEVDRLSDVTRPE